MTKVYLMVAGISGFIAVFMGAVGSHLLMGKLSPEHMAAFNTAVQMQMVHTLAILSIAFFNRYVGRSFVNTVYYLFLLGILLFSFPVYLISTVEVTKISFSFLSFLPPLGGVAFMLGWIAVFWSGLTYVHHKRGHKHD